jgi:hypothetical protein
MPGVNTLYAGADADLSSQQRDWNRRHRKAMTQFIAECTPEGIPDGHSLTESRIVPRARGMFSRKGLCAVRVLVQPKQFSDDGCAERAIFSMFELAAGPAGAAGAVAAQPKLVESQSERFLVDYYISYDIRGLSAAQPNAPVPVIKLKTSELNDAAFAIDIAVGRRLQLQPGVAAGGTAAREIAEAAFQRVKPLDACVFVDLGQLCQPLWTFPYLRDYARSRDFLKQQANKWDADQWLVCSQMF